MQRRIARAGKPLHRACRSARWGVSWPGPAPQVPVDTGRQVGAPSFFVAAFERWRLVALALGLAGEVDAIGVSL